MSLALSNFHPAIDITADPTVFRFYQRNFKVAKHFQICSMQGSLDPLSVAQKSKF